MISAETPVKTLLRVCYTSRAKEGTLGRSTLIEYEGRRGELAEPFTEGTLAKVNFGGQVVWFAAEYLEVDNPSHSDKKIYGSEATLGEFCKVVEPVMEFINAHFDPHTRVIIESTNAEILSGLATHNTMKFVKD